MHMVRIEIEASASLLSSIEDAVYALGVQGLELEDESTGMPRGRILVRIHLPEGRAAIEVCGRILGAVPRATVTMESYAPEPTTMAAPVKLGSRFVVLASGGSVPRGNRRVVLRLDETAAFGDGLHETTQLCVETLESIVDRKRHRRALDVGTGTGILALVALELGVAEVVATDVDALALAAVRRAARTHGVSNRINVRKTLPRETFPLVVANLYRDVLLPLAPQLAARLAPKGTLVLSGFGPGSRREIVARYEVEGLELLRVRRRGDWCAAVFVRPSGRHVIRA